jgi:hypothetical protein
VSGVELLELLPAGNILAELSSPHRGEAGKPMG